METNKIIDYLGGTSATAEMCGITTGAVSQWRTSENGIPNAWLKFFQSSRPDVFEKIESESAGTKKRAA